MSNDKTYVVTMTMKGHETIAFMVEGDNRWVFTPSRAKATRFTEEQAKAWVEVLRFNAANNNVMYEVAPAEDAS